MRPKRDYGQASVYLLPSLLRLLQTVLLARLAGAEMMGLVLAAMILPITLPRLIDGGMPLAAGYFTRRDAALAGQIWTVALSVALAAGAVVAVVLHYLPLFPFADERVGLLLRDLRILMAIFVILQLLRDVALSQLVALERHRAYLLASLLPVIIGPSGLLILLLLDLPMTPRAVVELLVVSESLGAIVAVGASALAWRRSRGLSRPAAIRGEILWYGLCAYPSSIAKIITMRADRAVLTTLLPASAYAIYAVTLSLRDAALLPSNAYGLVLMNQMTAAHNRGEAVRAAVRAGILFVGSLLGAGMVAFAIAAPWLVPALLGREFEAAVPLMSLAMISTLFIAISGVYWTMFVAIGRPQTMSAANIASAAIGLAVVIPATTLWGLVGAISGVIAASLATLLVSMAMAKRIFARAERAPETP